MDVILGHRPATQPPVIVNSMEDSRPGDTTIHAGDEPAADTAGDAAGEPQPNERENASDQELDDIQPSGTGHQRTPPVVHVQAHPWHLSKESARDQKEIKMTRLLPVN